MTCQPITKGHISLLHLAEAYMSFLFFLFIMVSLGNSNSDLSLEIIKRLKIIFIDVRVIPRIIKFPGGRQ